MTIKTGDKIPSAKLAHMTSEGPKPITTDEVFKGKRVVLFALPGAFTPTCSAAHLPGYVTHVDKIKAKGIDTVACLSVNDPFVMDAWGKSQNAENILMLADGNGEFTKAVGMELDLSANGLGVRSRRYSMVVDDGVVTALNIEPSPGQATVSGAENLLQQL